MADQDITVLVPVVLVWTFIFTFIIGVLATWTVQSIHPFIGISAGALCAIALLRFRGVV